jgi:hypothetical protein
VRMVTALIMGAAIGPCPVFVKKLDRWSGLSRCFRFKQDLI